VTHKTNAIKARSESLASATLRLCNAEDACFMGSPEGPGPGPSSPQGVVARSLCANGTRPYSRLALWATRPGREPSNSVNRP